MAKKIAPKDAENVDNLINQIETLSAENRALVLERLRQESVIIINDWLGQNRRRPCAIILYSRGNWESIDIIASVQNNAATIGHPAILVAIQRWEQTYLYQYSLSRSINDREKSGQAAEPETRNARASWKAARGDFKGIARGHLERIGKAILDAAENPKRRKSNLTVFKGLTKRIDEVDMDYLKIIWKLLSEDEIHYKSYGISEEDGREHKKKRSEKDKLEILKRRSIERFAEFGLGEEPLSPSPLAFSSPKLKIASMKGYEAMFAIPFDFLSSAECKPFLDKQGSWPEFRNAYIQWRTGYKKSTVKNYGSRASKDTEQTGTDLNLSLLVPDALGSNHYYASDIGNAFLLPTVPCTLRDCPCRERER